MDLLDQEIIRLYNEGNSYRQITDKTGACSARIAKNVKGQSRTLSESVKLAHSQGRGKITEAGRKKLSDTGKTACMNNKKFWTKPEKMFFQILIELGYGVNIPSYIEDVIGIKGSEDGEFVYQYPFQRYVLDFADVINKVAYVINGDFWHSNPLLYDKDNLTKVQKHNVWHDNNRKAYLENKGWKVCIVWESEVYWNKECVIERIRAMREPVNPPLLHGGDAQPNTEIAHDWSERLKALWFKEPSKKLKPFVSKECPICLKEFKTKDEEQKYCTNLCATKKLRKVERPSKEELIADKESSMPMLAIGEKYGVSDNCIRKWFDYYGIERNSKRKIKPRNK